MRLSIDEEPIELSLWDIRGIDYDPTWLNDAHVALVCFSVNIGSTDSKGKHLGRVSSTPIFNQNPPFLSTPSNQIPTPPPPIQQITSLSLSLS